MAEFIVYALPRSRTAWMAAFLTYPGWLCDHEQAVTMRGEADIARFLGRGRHGTVETGVSPAWRIINALRPGIRETVVHRPIDEAIASCLRLDLGRIGARYDVGKLKRNFRYMTRCLRQIAARPGVLSLDFADLDTEDGCAALFEHCLQQKFDRAWWLGFRARNIQMDVLAHLRYCLENRPAIDALKRECRGMLRRLAVAGAA